MAKSELEIVIKGKDQTGGLFDKLGGSLNKLAGIAAGVAVGGIIALGAGLAFAVGEARESIAVNKELEAVIASTGGVAGITAQAARDLAASLQAVTNFTDEAITKGESMLLTFTNIGQDVFPDATEAMLNMAQKFGSVDEAAVQLGKALNDPISGVTALRRVGVMLTDQQEDQIKRFMEMGDIAGAQRVILAELGTEFGGLARAAADPIVQLQNALADVGETIGMAVMPLITQLAQQALPMVQQAMVSIQPFLNGFSAFFSTLAAGKGILTSLAAGLLMVGMSGETVQKVLDFIGPLISTLQAGWPGIRAALMQWAVQFWDWLTGSGGVTSQIGPKLTELITSLNTAFLINWPAVMTALKEWSNRFWDWLTGPGGAMERTGTALSSFVGTIQAWINANQETLQTLGQNLGLALVDGLTLAVKNQEKINSFVAQLVMALGAAVMAAQALIIDIGAAIGAGLVRGIIQKLTGAEISAQMGAAIQGAVGGLAGGLNPVGQIPALAGNLQSGAGTDIANLSQVQGGGGGASFNAANLTQAIMAAFQSAPIQITNQTVVDGKVVAETVSHHLGSQARSLSRQGGFNPR